MLISALCDYYDVLSKKGLVLPDGYSKIGIHFIIALTSEGKVESLIDCREIEVISANGKTKEQKLPKDMIFLKRKEASKIDANIIEHRPLYIFGLDYDAKKREMTAFGDKNKAKKSHEEFIKTNLDFIDGIDAPMVNAYRNFIKTWNPEEELHNEQLLKMGNSYSTSRFAFCLAGHPEILLQDDPQIKAKWEKYYAASMESGSLSYGQCCISGEYLPIESIHAKIKGMPGGSSMGNTMVSFNSAAEESYGKKQSINSCISCTAAKKYTEALNYLLADKRHRTLIDETTYIYWAASGDEVSNDIFSALTFGNTMDSAHTDEWLRSIFDGIKSGISSREIIDGIGNIDSNVNFYVVGIKPNSARLALKCIYRQRFGKILQNTIQHYSDMQIGNGGGKPISVRRICKELISPKSKNDKVSPALMAKLFDAIINGTAYPDALLGTVIRRVKTDSDEETGDGKKNSSIKMNSVRMGLIKACINRNSRLKGKKEEIKMTIDTENKNPAYLCGRLFCKLEDIQCRASGDVRLNRTIKDSYFSLAATRPAVVFPKLLLLSQHHLAKLDSKTSYFMDKDVAQIMGMLGGEFPSSLSLKDQGIFILGYYQQKNAKFDSKATEDRPIE